MNNQCRRNVDRVWIFMALIPCAFTMNTKSSVSTIFTETMPVRIANELKYNWHSDSIDPVYESAITPTEFYLKQILKQLTLLNKKFDRMMIRMIDSTVRDDENDDRNIPKIAINDTRPDCESLIGTEFPSGIYHFERPTRKKNFEWLWNIYAIYCDQTAGGGWTVIQRRGGSTVGSVDFSKTWDDYAKGFGNLDGEFWMGNEWIHRLTKSFGPYELRVEIVDEEDNMEWAQYSNFSIGSKEENYRLLVGSYNGNATDSLSPRNSTAFSTYDRRNGEELADLSCPSTIAGGWWYLSHCVYANLNGDYRENFKGVVWNALPHVDHNRSLKSAKMMIRLKNHSSLKTSESANFG